jgi:TolA-binding protein
LTVAFVFFLISHRQRENEEAWNQLGALQGQAMQNQTAQALQGLNEWSKRFQGTSAGPYARFLKADLLYKTSDYAASAQIYADLTQNASPEPLRPLALSAQVPALEMAGQPTQALGAAQQFSERYPDHFLAGPMLLAQARLQETTGNTSAAVATYDRFIALYPQSPSTSVARTRLQALSGNAPPAPTPSAHRVTLP